MKYGKGTIIFARRTRFEDNGEYDNRSGHPGMIPIASDDITEDTYFLMLTSNTLKKESFPDQYYDLSDHWKEVHLKKPSLINLKYIYKGHVSGEKLGGLTPQLYKDVIREFKKYQEKYPSENYGEIKGKL